mmetsp:Transcript_13667/g.24766  ORF Transcript_13667/g.24766 Transcript_13667/m.24766 type:complete len:173 (+) Transcript_13667:41-559(+)|eukprot:CAMPEP_0201599296 /NCGR_PEP_ID=MMETSP0492-20130828/810_1 /ASSEMBLY_ACC=CAM_ASM_000837 /TAXON_ID=420259 /ORGANISM="Thalassiosira gravida, Strain GMp14c1" /LENGTH=172 /DNA_ID=CAMNT_0048061853 /DNA_START=8 /DNA_END=526 /DNA_ORIENTATION=+
MTTLTGLKPFALVGGYNAAELWPLVNLIMPGWLLLMFAPRWKHTPALTLLGPIFFAALYSLLSVSEIFLNAEPSGAKIDMSTLDGVVQLFTEPSGVFIGWVHYLVYDKLVARWIVMDSVERGGDAKGMGFHLCVMVPILVVSLALGPMGWLAYLGLVRPFLLPVGETKAKSS